MTFQTNDAARQTPAHTNSRPAHADRAGPNMRETPEMIDAIAHAIGLDGAELAARRRFLEFDERDVAVLRDVHELLEAERDTFSDTFYAHLLDFPRMRELLGDSDTTARLRRAQSGYFSSLTGGEYGEAYVRERLRVGATHQRIGLDPKWYIGAYRKYLSELFAMLRHKLRHDPERLGASCDAVLKIVCFDMGLALDTYAHADQRSVLQSRAYLEQVIEAMPAGLAVIDAARRVRSMNRSMADLLGTPEEAGGAGLPLAAILPDAELAARIDEALSSGAAQHDVLVTLDGRADGVRHVEFNIRRMQQDDGDMLLLIGQDVTFRRKARLRLQESEEFFRLTFSQAAVGIVLLGADGRLLRVNRKMAQILGYTEVELLQRFFQQLTLEADLPDELALIRRLKAGEIGDYQRERRLVRRDGSPVWVNVSVSMMRDANGNQRFISVVEDISRRKLAEEALTRLASHDTLTGLPNRLLLQDRLAQAIVHAGRTRNQVAVMFIDLDRFKHVNDSLGHDAGDRMIVEIARRLAASLRESDTVARQGGDEFVVVLPELSGEGDAATVARKLLDNLFQPLLLCGQEVFPTGSIGIAMYPRDGLDAATLLKNADSAMYQSKGQGGNHFSFYAAALGLHAAEHLRLEGALQRALQRQEFLLHYQPVVDIASGAVSGVEALLRWQPQGKALVPPSDFIPLLEETGLIVPVGEWVLATAMAQQVAWRRMGLPPVRISVNLSARQFLGQDVARQVGMLIERSGCDPAWLTLEITESVLMQNPVAAAATMERLAAMGVQLAIDDFGTGYSSLASLKRFPIHSLKIDRSFVSDLTRDADDAAIVNAVIALAHSMRLNVIAEGVETQEQLDFLSARGCDQMQGYCFSRPVAPQGIEALLQAAKAA
ncbi:EAL domain-containing protein [Massilia sp.]|uniref:EAL domain-containing protein n=1 Tax=Massilia sp. TaxID=1882437 RepID=UPI00289D72A0|nr:EAL domain-containing protein [Massilia sp.]